MADDHPDKAKEIGLEKSPEEYVAALVGIFREVRRILRDDGVLWLNIGDSYARNPAKGQHKPGDVGKQTYIIEDGGGRSSNGCIPDGLKPKDLIGIPWMLAFALRADGWYLRADNIWGKPNGMPESATDRPTRSHEYVFLLSKSERYWYDHRAVRTAPKASAITRLAQNVESQAGSARANGGNDDRPMKAGGRGEQSADGANLRSIWWVPPAQYRESHYAVMPDLVAEICIRSGCPDGGTVLDPFGGAGTTGLVADRLGRNAVLIELNSSNGALIEKRIVSDGGLFAEVSSA